MADFGLLINDENNDEISTHCVVNERRGVGKCALLITPIPPVH